MQDATPRVWVLDFARATLSQLAPLFEGLAEATYFPPNSDPDWTVPPDAVFFSAEIPGGAGGEVFASLLQEAGGIPLLAVSRLRSYAQALEFFRAGATDFLALPLAPADLRERLDEALLRATELALRGAMVEIEHLGPDESDSVPVSGDFDGSGDYGDSGDLAPGPVTLSVQSAVLAGSASSLSPAVDAEPVMVEGLPVPVLWEELPCGLVIFDSSGSAVFSNGLALELFGRADLPELRRALEEDRSSFAAHSVNHKALPDNHWPHVQAWKTRVARSAVLSVEKPDRRRAWLRIDCLPHLADGKISRLAMTVVNLTGELPPLTVQPDAAPLPPAGKKDKGRGKGRRRK